MGILDDARFLQSAKRTNRLLIPKQKKIKGATYQGKDSVDGTDIIEVDGDEPVSGFRLISNKPISTGDRVSLRPSASGLQRADARNVAPDKPIPEEDPDIAAYYVGVSYLSFVGCGITDLVTQQTIELEGEGISGLVIRSLNGVGQITYALNGSSFDFNWETLGEFLIEYKRDSGKLAVIFVSLSAQIVSPFDGFIGAYAHFLCGFLGKKIIGLLLDDVEANEALNTAKKLKSEVDITFSTNTVLRDFMNLRIERFGVGGEIISITDFNKNAIKFSASPQYGLILFQWIPLTTDLLTFELSRNKKSRGRVTNKLKKLEIKTIKSNQELPLNISIFVYENPPDFLQPPLQGLSGSTASYFYTDLDVASYDSSTSSVSNGDLEISGLSGSVADLGVESYVIVNVGFSNISWIDYFARYALVENERILFEITFSPDALPPVSSDLYGSAINGINTFFICQTLTFSIRFKRELGSNWFEL